MIALNAYAARHKQQKIAVDADQVEKAAISSGPQVYDAGIADERISGALEELDEQGVSGQGRLQVLDLTSDTASGEIAKEIGRRKSMMGTTYPFAIDHNSITHTPSSSGFYEFCLAASLSPNITTANFKNIPRKFERMAAELLQILYGSNTKALHLGFPRDTSIGTTFKKGMATLARESSEWVWHPEDGLPAEPTTGGDEGVDFVVWTPMPDKRQGSLFVLGQCACGDDWLQKWNDLSIGKLEKWFRPMTRVPPVRAFATPFHVVDALLYEAIREAGLTFDRARLVAIAEGLSTPAQRSGWLQNLKPLTELVISPAPASVAA